MAAIVFNISLGRVAEYYNRVKSNDPANCAFILVPLETTGLEIDSVLKDKDSLADLLSGTTNEQTTLGRKTLTDADLAAFPAPDDANDRYELTLPTVTWAAGTGSAISKIVVCYDDDTTSGTDGNIIPVTMFDYVFTPVGTNISVNSFTFYRAQ